MQGLKKQEGSKFEQFFSIVQDQAHKNGFIFFLFAGEGHEKETDSLEMMDMSGWLIPRSKASDFEKDWNRFKRQSDMAAWADSFVFAQWSDTDGTLEISFAKF